MYVSINVYTHTFIQDIAGIFMICNLLIVWLQQHLDYSVEGITLKSKFRKTSGNKLRRYCFTDQLVMNQKQ